MMRKYRNALRVLWRNIGVKRAVVAGLALMPVVLAASAQAGPVPLTDFGSNPGKLNAYVYKPDTLHASAPLVVVLHGCQQNAQDYATDSGWIKMADDLGLVLVLPEQTQANNQNKCFNWFLPADIQRDKGEALSIKQMVDKVKSDQSVDPKRIYVTGLSAGGAMTGVMLATYPDVFAGGGIVAGIPYGCAGDMLGAVQCMNTAQASGLPTIGLPINLPGGPPAGGLGMNIPLPSGMCTFFPLLCPPSGNRGPTPNGGRTPEQWGDLVRAADPDFSGPYPKVSIWHGSADTTVNPANETKEVEQWTNVLKAGKTPSSQDTVDGFPHATYSNSDGKAVVESYLITGMSHAVPIDPGSGAKQCGTPAQWVVDEKICASFYIAKFWGLTPQGLTSQ
jgi:poly(hydroxyalkanoate) depolymerase family esterase